MPRLGPNAVGVRAVAACTPGVAFTSDKAAGARPGPAVETTTSAESPSSRCCWTTWSIVVVLNSRVQLIATVRTSGVLADERRRAADARSDDPRKPPTGEVAPRIGRRNGPRTRAAT